MCAEIGLIIGTITLHIDDGNVGLMTHEYIIV